MASRRGIIITTARITDVANGPRKNQPTCQTASRINDFPEGGNGPTSPASSSSSSSSFSSCSQSAVIINKKNVSFTDPLTSFDDNATTRRSIDGEKATTTTEAATQLPINQVKTTEVKIQTSSKEAAKTADTAATQGKGVPTRSATVDVAGVSGRTDSGTTSSSESVVTVGGLPSKTIPVKIQSLAKTGFEKTSSTQRTSSLTIRSPPQSSTNDREPENNRTGSLIIRSSPQSSTNDREPENNRTGSLIIRSSPQSPTNDREPEKKSYTGFLIIRSSPQSPTNDREPENDRTGSLIIRSSPQSHRNDREPDNEIGTRNNDPSKTETGNQENDEDGEDEVSESDSIEYEVTQYVIEEIDHIASVSLGRRLTLSDVRQNVDLTHVLWFFCVVLLLTFLCLLTSQEFSPLSILVALSMASIAIFAKLQL